MALTCIFLHLTIYITIHKIMVLVCSCGDELMWKGVASLR